MGEAAKRAGVGRKTIYRWLALPGFQAELARRVASISDMSRIRIQAGLDLALDAATLSLTSQNERIRLRAWGSFLSFYSGLKQVLDLEQRVRMLEGKDEAVRTESRGART